MIKKLTDSTFLFSWGTITLSVMSVCLKNGGTFGDMSRAADQKAGDSLSAFSRKLDLLLHCMAQPAAVQIVEIEPELMQLLRGPQQVIQVCETLYT